MATARLYIPVGTQTYGPIPGGVDTTEAIGSNTAEVISIAANGNVILDASFVRGNDCIKILGLAGDYLVQANAAGIVLTGKAGTPAAGASISIPAFAAGGGLKIDFLNITDVDLITTNGTTYQLNGPGSADQTVTGSAVALSIAAGTSGGGGGGGSTTIDLTVAADNLTGTSGDDTFEAIVSVNQNGEQTNQLQTGDRLNGGNGFDTLDATVQDASALNGRPVAEVVLRTWDVEHLMINAEQANDSSDDDSVELDLERAYGVEKITSSFSDADLTVYNVNTLGDGGPTDATNGLDNGRPTASIELCMDHTAGDNVLFCASDFEVYFDADYLIPGEPTNETVLVLQIMDIDNNFLTSQPLLTNPYDRIFINLPGVPSGSDPVVIVTPSSFTDTGIAAYQKLAQSIQAGLNAAGLSTWQVSVGTTFSVVDPDGDPGGSSLITGWEIIITDPSGTPLNPGDVTFGASGQIPAQTDYQKEIIIDRETTTDLITSILCVNKVGQGGEGGDFVVGSMSTGGIERFILEVEGYDAGTGGVNVDQDSSLASLATTNNTLREVILWAASDVTADIVIGNGNTEGVVPNMGNYYNVSWDEAREYDEEYCGNLYPDGNPCDLTDTRNNAMRDVQLFTAAGAQGRAALPSAVDVTLWAHLSDAFTGKYLDLMDDDADPKADNIIATYLFSGGNDTLNMNISKSNFAFQGAATREDFAFYADMGNGNDTVLFQIGDGQFGEPYGEYTNGNVDVVDGSLEELAQVFGSSANWYTNHMLNDNVTIVTGNGRDFVHTWGSTAANIHLGAGDDIAYTDNSGGGYGGKRPAEMGEYGSDFNCCRATWVFNAQSEKGDAPEVNDLLSFGRASITNAVNVSLFVHYQDLLVQVEVGDSWGSVNGVTISDLTINQAIKDAINNHPALSAFLEAKDGPSGTLLVLSKVDGKHKPSDLGITLGRWIGVDGSPVALTAAQLAPGAQGKLLGAYTAAQLNLLGWNTDGTPYTNGHSEPGQGARWDSEFGRDYGKKLSGVDSVNVNNNRVWGSTGSDKIALSSNATSIEHIVIKKVATEVFASQAEPDYIMNFTAAISNQIIPAVAEVQEICLSYDTDQGGVPGDVSEQPLRVTVTVYSANGAPTVSVIDIPAGQTAAQMNEAIRAAVDGDLGIVATIDDNGTPANTSDDCVVLTYPTGANHPLATATITALVPTEVQTLTVSGAPNPAGSTMVVSVSFAGHLIVTDSMASDASNETIAAEIEEAFDEAGFSDVTASSAGAVVTLNYFGGTDPATAGTGIAVAAGNNLVDITVATTDTFDAFVPGVSIQSVAVTDGAPQINPALGYDIFDVVDVLGVHPPSGYYFQNTKQDNSAGAEYNAVNALIDNGKNGIAIIDTLDGGAGEFAYTGSPTTELARLQQMVTAGDGVAETSAFKHIIITVRNDGVTDTSVAGNPAGNGLTANWYEVTDPTGTGNATVQYMGTMKLLGYDSTAPNKDPIGDWDAMTLANFTYQTPTQLMDTYVGGIV
jgi:hypothetical protein